LPREKHELKTQASGGETAKKIADAFRVTVDYLVDENARPSFDKLTVKRLQEIETLNTDEKVYLMALMDAFPRYAKAKKAYAF